VTLDRAILIALVVCGVAGGVLLAVVGAFYIPASYGPLSLGDAIALLAVGPFCHFVGRAARSTWVGTVPGVVWVLVAMVLGARRPEGDLVVLLDVPGVAFLLLGTVSAAVGIGTIAAGVRLDQARVVSPNGSSEREFGR
jgi:hypothetical protein